MFANMQDAFAALESLNNVNKRIGELQHQADTAEDEPRFKRFKSRLEVQQGRANQLEQQLRAYIKRITKMQSC